MAKTQQSKPRSTREWLVQQIDSFLVKNPHLTPEAFGWASVRDTTLVDRLHKGKDVTTRKLDALIAYMANPNQQRRK